MKRLLLTCLTVILLVGFGTTNLFADGWALGDWSANVNGPTYNPPDLSSPVTSSPAGFPTTGGSALGTFTFTINSGGLTSLGSICTHTITARLGISRALRPQRSEQLPVD